MSVTLINIFEVPAGDEDELLRRSREAGLSLTVGEVAVIAAGIDLASPLHRILDHCPA